MRRGIIPRPVEPEPDADDASSASMGEAPSSPAPGQKRATESDEADDIGDRLEEMHMSAATSGSGSGTGPASPAAAVPLTPGSRDMTPIQSRKMRLKTSSCSMLPTPDLVFSPPAGPFSAESTPLRPGSASPSMAMAGSMPDCQLISRMMEARTAGPTISIKERERRETFLGLMDSCHWTVLEKFCDVEWMRKFRATTQDPVIARDEVYGMKDVFALLENEICKPLVAPELAQCALPNLAIVSKPGQGTRTAIRSIASGAGTTDGPMFNVITHRFLHQSESRQDYGFFHDIYRIANENAPCVVVIHRMSQRAGMLAGEAFSRLYESLFRAQEVRSDATRTPSVWTVIVDAEPPGKVLPQFDCGIVATPINIEPLVKEDLVHYTMSRIALRLRHSLHDEDTIQDLLAYYRPLAAAMLLANVAEFTLPMRDIKTYVDRLFEVVQTRRSIPDLRQDRMFGTASAEAFPNDGDFQSALASFRTAKMGHKASSAERDRQDKEEQKLRKEEQYLAILAQSQTSAGHAPATASNHQRRQPRG